MKTFCHFTSRLFVLCWLLSTSSFIHSQTIEDLGITLRNFPTIDGSDSTEPLRTMLMCKILGFHYYWLRSPFIQYDSIAPNLLWYDTDLSYEDKKYLSRECLLEANTHGSFINLINGKAEVIFTARASSPDEIEMAQKANVELIEKPIAKDALAFIVNPTNAVQNISSENIRNIYSGTIKNWSEVGGKDTLISPYIRNRNSGSQVKFEEMVMQGTPIMELPELNIGTVMMTPYHQIEYDKNGIAFTPFYYYSVIVNNNTVKAIGVDGVPMTKQNIMNNTYPYVSDVYAVVRADIDKESPAYRLFEFITTPAGQAIVEESGYVPLAQFTDVKDVTQSKGSITVQNKILRLSDLSRAKKVEIINAEGKKVMIKQLDDGCADLSVLPSGTYIVRVCTASGATLLTRSICLQP